MAIPILAPLAAVGGKVAITAASAAATAAMFVIVHKTYTISQIQAQAKFNSLFDPIELATKETLSRFIVCIFNSKVLQGWTLVEVAFLLNLLRVRYYLNDERFTPFGIFDKPVPAEAIDIGGSKEGLYSYLSYLKTRPFKSISYTNKRLWCDLLYDEHPKASYGKFTMPSISISLDDNIVKAVAEAWKDSYIKSPTLLALPKLDMAIKAYLYAFNYANLEPAHLALSFYMWAFNSQNGVMLRRGLLPYMAKNIEATIPQLVGDRFQRLLVDVATLIGVGVDEPTRTETVNDAIRCFAWFSKNGLNNLTRMAQLELVCNGKVDFTSTHTQFFYKEIENYVQGINLAGFHMH